MLFRSGTAAAGHLTEVAPKPTSPAVATMPRRVATFSTHTVAPLPLAVNLPPNYGAWPVPGTSGSLPPQAVSSAAATAVSTQD